jgi:hypothetical protein
VYNVGGEWVGRREKIAEEKFAEQKDGCNRENQNNDIT